jgi:nucleotide-binding universal stress UspA family protein
VSARVVVGIDGSPGAETALHFAADEAAQRGLPLRIVYAWEAPAGTYVGEAFAPTADGFVEAEHHADDVLRAALERVAAGAAIETEALAIEGHPAKVLIEQSQDAALLVVGSRGRGAAAGLLLGSVSQKLAQHAPCPLAIVPCAKK